MDSSRLSENKLTELLEPYTQNKEVTVLDLYNHVSKLYNENRDVITELYVAENTKPQDKLGDVNSNIVGETNLIDKPLGTFGDITLNEVVKYFRELEWNILLDRTQVTIQAVPTAMNLLGGI